MKQLVLWIILILTGVGCYQRRDPLLQAAQDLERAASELVEQDEAQLRRLNSLRLGMSASEVLNTAGPPSARQSSGASLADSREVWIYRGTMRVLATLTFVNQHLTALRIE